MIEIKLRLTPLMSEITKVLQTGNKSSRLGPTALFLSRFLELGVLNKIFTLLEWAAQVLLQYETTQKNKLLIHKQILHECMIAPMNFFSWLISGEFLKRDQIKYYLQPNELSPLVAIYKLRLTMMRTIVQPMLLHFLEEKAELYLAIADNYDKVFSLSLEGVICHLCANTFFSANSAFDPNGLRSLSDTYNQTFNKSHPSGAISQTNMFQRQFETQQQQTQTALKMQLIEMGFDSADVDLALDVETNDFGRALDFLCSLGVQKRQQQW